MPDPFILLGPRTRKFLAWTWARGRPWVPRSMMLTLGRYLLAFVLGGLMALLQGHAHPVLLAGGASGSPASRVLSETTRLISLSLEDVQDPPWRDPLLAAVFDGVHSPGPVGSNAPTPRKSKRVNILLGRLVDPRCRILGASSWDPHDVKGRFLVDAHGTPRLGTRQKRGPFQCRKNPARSLGSALTGIPRLPLCLVLGLSLRCRSA